MGKGISASQLLWTVGYLALAIIICMVVMAWIRKRYMAIEKKTEATFTLPELRALKKNNDLTEKEYDLLRQNIIETYSKNNISDATINNENWGNRDNNKINHPNKDQKEIGSDDDEDGDWIMINNNGQ